jgi:hypothetical protein
MRQTLTPTLSQSGRWRRIIPLGGEEAEDQQHGFLVLFFMLQQHVEDACIPQ